MNHPTPIPVYSEDIKSTEFFQGLDHVAQALVLRHKNVKSIRNGVNVASNIGYEKWNDQTGDRYYNRMIVKEILELKKMEV